MQVVLASNNLKKILELQALLEPMHLKVAPQKDFNILEVEETGKTFIENALIKARHAAEQSNLPALADDSGLEVFALNGAPGIYSARFAGETSNDFENNNKLLSKLKNVPPEKRAARFHCVIAFLLHAEDPTPLICHGSWEGIILSQPQGAQGFGYDPLFWLPELKKTAAELSLIDKNQLSHRSQALKQFIQQLPHKLNSKGIIC